MEIIFITDLNNPCEKCKGMRNALELLRSIFNNLFIREIHWEKEESIVIGDKHDMMEIPICVIGEYAFCGENWTFEEFVESVKKTIK